MNISMKEKDGCPVFDISGAISLADTISIETFIYSKLSGPCQRAFISLAHIDHISSSLIGTFVRVQKTVKDRGIHICFINASPEALSLFRITGIIDQFHFYNSEADIPASDTN